MLDAVEQVSCPDDGGHTRRDEQRVQLHAAVSARADHTTGDEAIEEAIHEDELLPVDGVLIPILVAEIAERAAAPEEPRQHPAQRRAQIRCCPGHVGGTQHSSAPRCDHRVLEAHRRGEHFRVPELVPPTHQLHSCDQEENDLVARLAHFHRCAGDEQSGHPRPDDEVDDELYRRRHVPRLLVLHAQANGGGGARDVAYVQLPLREGDGVRRARAERQGHADRVHAELLPRGRVQRRGELDVLEDRIAQRPVAECLREGHRLVLLVVNEHVLSRPGGNHGESNVMKPRDARASARPPPAP
mmetsp:Transcript_9892/g.26661  ORF Transcript_9892/g.26661 Transcript_9892/m.26661 type:complete len:300 (-) Transcript_9892:29-928(-)